MIARSCIALSLAVAVAAPVPAQDQSTPMHVVSPAWLADRLNDPGVVVLEITHGDNQQGPRIPGARAMPYDALRVSANALSTELPPADEVRARFEALGISDSTLVVVYAHEAPMATRALFTLDYLGHSRWAYLDGGLTAWRAEGRPTTTENRAVKPGRMTGAPRPGVAATADWITARIGKPGIALIDTRTDGEYLGTGNRSGMPSAGHLTGARQLEWQQLFRADEPLRLRPRSEVESLYAERVQRGDTVVTYCWVGYRASATYFAARWLGYEARMYDGSYQDWQKRQLPVRAGSAP